MVPKLKHISSLLPESKRHADKTVAAILLQVLPAADNPVLVAVGGPGGTGKSTFCAKLAGMLPDADVLRLDDYKTSRQARDARNIYGPHPDANRIGLIQKHLRLLRKGDAVDKPVYDRTTGTADMTEPFIPRRYIIIDGEVATYHHFHSLIDFAVFIDADWQTQLATRLNRDRGPRGYTQEKAVATFLHSNLKEFGKYGEESKTWADVHLYCHDDYLLEIEAVSEQVYVTCSGILAQNNRVIDIEGCICAVPVPFTGTNLIDEESFVRHLEFLYKNGIRRILVNGTTGEFFSLTRDERRKVLRIARFAFPGMVIFGAGCEGLEATMQQIQWAERYGADALAVLPPYYFSDATEQGLIEYFKYISAHTGLPMLLYNFPAHTGNALTPAMLDAVPHAGLKDSSGNLDLLPAVSRYFTGADTLIAQSGKKGGAGFVSGTAACMPEPYVNMEKGLAGKDESVISDCQARITRGDAVLGGPENIARVKYALSQVLPGYPAAVRLPLMPLDKKEQTAIDGLLASVK